MVKIAQFYDHFIFMKEINIYEKAKGRLYIIFKIVFYIIKERLKFWYGIAGLYNIYYEHMTNLIPSTVCTIDIIIKWKHHFAVGFKLTKWGEWKWYIPNKSTISDKLWGCRP